MPRACMRWGGVEWDGWGGASKYQSRFIMIHMHFCTRWGSVGICDGAPSNLL